MRLPTVSSKGEIGEFEMRENRRPDCQCISLYNFKILFYVHILDMQKYYFCVSMLYRTAAFGF